MVKSELGFALFLTEKMEFDALGMEFDHETWTLEMRFWAKRGLYAKLCSDRQIVNPSVASPLPSLKDPQLKT